MILKIRYGSFCELNYRFEECDCEILVQDNKDVVAKLKRNQNTELLVKDRANILNKPCTLNIEGKTQASCCIRDILENNNFLNLHFALQEFTE